MPGKDGVVDLVFAGDEKRLVRAADNAARSVQQMSNKIESSSSGMASALSADAAKAEKSLGDLSKELRGLPDANVSVTADTAKAESGIDALKREGDTIKLPVVADTSKAQSDIRGIRGQKVDVKADADTSKAKQALQGLGDLGTDIGDKFGGGMASGMKGGIAGGIAALGSMIVDGIADKISEDKVIGRKLNLKFKGMAGEVDKWKGLFDTNALEDVSNWLGGGSSDQNISALADMGIGVEELAETALRASKTFKDFGSMATADQRALAVEIAKTAAAAGIDVPEALKAADVAARTFGLSAWDSTRLVSRGFDEMGPRADDWAETLNEYPRYFEAMGLGAEDMFRVVKQGMDGGAMNTDKVADAWKEFGIRVVDGSKTTGDALKSLGLNAADVPKKIAEGGPAARAAVDDVVDALRNIEDPIERNRIGVQLFGTQWEDTMRDAIDETDVLSGRTKTLGDDVVTAAMKMNGQGDVALRKMIGSMSEADLKAAGASVKIDTLGNKVVTLPNGKQIKITAEDMATNTIQTIAGRNYSAVIKLYGEFQGFSRVPSGAVLSSSSARGNATGGRVRGPGSGTSDSIHRMVSNDEFITRASRAREPLNAKVLEAMNAGKDWQSLVAPRISMLPASASAGAPTTVQLVITGTGGLYESVQKGIRDGDIQIKGVNV
jgi:hypothetical protein